MLRRGIVGVLVFAALGVFSPWTVGAEEGVRIESKIYFGSEKEPKAENTTIFHRGLIYDYLRNPAEGGHTSETIVLDLARGRFILLDPKRRVRTELTTEEVAALCENFRQWALNQTDAFTRFLASPQFEEVVEESSGDLVLQSPWVTYRVATVEADSDGVLQQFRDFTDWYARLNARLNPGYKLVFARLALNEVLHKRRQLPREITLVVQPRKALSFQKTVIRSEHQVIYHLVESDRDRIVQTGEFMAIFHPVDFSHYDRRSEP
jgi:hypothetical protein